MSALKNVSAASAVVLAVSMLAACGQKADQAGGGAPPPAEVGVITVAPRSVGLATELPGRLEASRVAQVRARAAGILQKRVFTEGSDVKAASCCSASTPRPTRPPPPAPRPRSHGPRPT